MLLRLLVGPPKGLAICYNKNFSLAIINVQLLLCKTVMVLYAIIGFTVSRIHIQYSSSQCIVNQQYCTISFSDYRAHTGPLFHILNIMTLTELHHYITTIHTFIYKITHGLLPTVFTKEFTFSKSARNPYTLQSQSHTKRICGTSMRNSAPKLWNICQL